MSNLFETMEKGAEDVGTASEVWVGKTPRELKIDFNDIEKIRLEELEGDIIIILSAKESRGKTGMYITALAVSENMRDTPFILSTGASAVKRKITTAMEKHRIPLKARVISVQGRDNSYFDLQSVNTVDEKKKPEKKQKKEKEVTE